ncbi:uncharacterized protein LOC135622257 isoform X2 [Musa acuminata AAA Group]|uniref:uncharacterized protein LOC135622257 isoform X2 n=1 Tax=Musa acuminata AAA Group TaxID=214697 RepID=UPI0031DB5939
MTVQEARIFTVCAHTRGFPRSLRPPQLDSALRMWRQYTSEKRKKMGDKDSDQSLSDEDESDKVAYDLDCSTSRQSLYHSHRVKDDMAPTKLSVASAAYKFQRGPFHSANNNHKGECTCSAINEEANELNCLCKKACSSSFISHFSEAKKSYKSGRSRDKPKFSIRAQLHSAELPSFCSMGINEECSQEGSESFKEHNDHDSRILEDSKAELLSYIEEDNQDLPVKSVTHELACALPLMAELLEGLEGKNGLTAGAPYLNSRSKKRKKHYSGGKQAAQLGSRILDNEDSLEFMGAGTSSEDEDHNQNRLTPAIEDIKQQTMGDLFQETFNISVGSPSLSNNRNAVSGYYGRLQQVMQIERDRHFEFLKQSQTGGKSPLNDLRCITVQILSRILEAKLTVCHCLLAESTKSQQGENDSPKCHKEGTLRTVIFSSRICGSVELEVGGFVRIHPPWYEIYLGVSDTLMIL